MYWTVRGVKSSLTGLSNSQATAAKTTAFPIFANTAPFACFATLLNSKISFLLFSVNSQTIDIFFYPSFLILSKSSILISLSSS